MTENKFYALWLALICVVVFIIQVLVSGFTELFVLNQQSYIQVWRFVTAIFLHGSLIHLTYNLFALVLFGLILEKLIGTKRFLIVFFASGILANIISVNFYTSALGASGAIFGIIGTLTIIKPLMTVWAFSLPMPLFVAAILWVIGDILGIFFPSGIANLAHLSGLALGLVIGLILRIKMRPGISYTRRINIPEAYMHAWEKRFMK